MDQTEFEIEKNFRCFPNPYLSNPPKHQLNYLKELPNEIGFLVSEILKNVTLDYVHKGYSVYTGTAGIGFMFLRLGETSEGDEKAQFFASAKKYILDNALICFEDTRKKPIPTFLEGLPGVYVQCAIIHHVEGRKDECQKYIDDVLALLTVVCDESFEVNETLYGRAGFLWSLMYLYKYFQQESISLAIEKVSKMIFVQGKKKKDRDSPLMWSWHSKKYLGAAHGVAGILYQLLQCPTILTSSNKKDIIGTINFLISQKFPSGNYPSSKGNDFDSAVQWCHGAPAVGLLFCKAYEVLGDKLYLEKAIEAADVVYDRGLLRKGLSLCHGIAGNAYLFLHLYYLTKDQKFLQWTLQFCSFSLSKEGRSLITQPDRPYSLFEGVAGTVCFYQDVLHCETRKPSFPCFDL